MRIPSQGAKIPFRTLHSAIYFDLIFVYSYGPTWTLTFNFHKLLDKNRLIFLSYIGMGHALIKPVMKNRNPIKTIARSATALLFGGALLFGAKVEINYDEPQTFSDVEANGMYSEAVFKRFASTFEETVKSLADDFLPKNAKLKMTVLDIDLAGEYEPSYYSGTENVRVIEGIYPPRLKFEYQVMHGDKVLAEGVAQTTDVTFMWNATNAVYEPMEFVYEKNLIEEWMRKNLKGISHQ